MKAPAHISFATLIYLGLLTSTGVTLSFLNWALLSAGSILPDVDTGASTVGRILPWVSRPIERRFGHRTLTHSVIFVSGLGVVMCPLLFLDRDLYCCLLLGYASHPLLDSCTVTGVRLLFPLSRARCVFPMDVLHPFRYRIASGTHQETVLTAIFVIACVPAFFVAHQGYERFIRVTQGTIESAVRDYNEFSRTHLVFGECAGYSLLTKERIQGVFHVAGSLDKQTLLIYLPDGRLHTLGKDFRAEYTSERISCSRGKRTTTTVREIDMTGSALIELPIESSGEIHLFGTLLLEEDPGIGEGNRSFSPLSGRGKELYLNYATPSDIDSAGIGGITVSSGTVIVRRITTQEDTLLARTRPALDRRLTVRIAPSDGVELLLAQGDSVARGEVLVIVTPLAGEREELSRLSRKLELLHEEARRRLSDYDEKVSALIHEVRGDSLELLEAERLERNGFVGPVSVRVARGRLTARRAKVVSLEEAKRLESRKTESASADLAEKLKTLRTRLQIAGNPRPVRSPASGIVRAIERRERSGTVFLTFSIGIE